MPVAADVAVTFAGAAGQAKNLRHAVDLAGRVREDFEFAEQARCRHVLRRCQRCAAQHQQAVFEQGRLQRRRGIGRIEPHAVDQGAEAAVHRGEVHAVTSPCCWRRKG